MGSRTANLRRHKMDQRALHTDTALSSAPFFLGSLSKPNSSLQTFKENSEGTPRSLLTENSCSTTSSQESSIAEHPYFEQSQNRNIWAMETRNHLGFEAPILETSSASPSSGSMARSPSNSLLLSLTDVPSPSFTTPANYRGGNRSRVPYVSQPQGDRFQAHNYPQQTARRGNTSFHRLLFQQVTQVGSGQSLNEMGGIHEALTVEDLSAMVRNLPASQPVYPVVASGLRLLERMDSRAVAALLKHVAKDRNLPQRSVEIFNWLRSLPPTHDLHHLCDVYTYTTVISLCGQTQALTLALELVAEMRSRGVARNVHTYSALMNTCIKCSELMLALDVFHQLQKEDCKANVVTYNTLVDVYGKLGSWQEAVGVIDEMRAAGLRPETRTFNTVIIAANICNQPLEALKVYKRMIKEKYEPTATTFTALISAYGKLGQLEEAMRVFNRMVELNCERNIITYGSLITACEKDNKWEVALSLLDDMRRDSVQPNTMTFNALLSACAQDGGTLVSLRKCYDIVSAGGKSEKAEALFQVMQARRCKPDASAYHAVLLAHIRAGHWRAALQALEALPVPQQAEPSVYSALVQCLWESGLPAAQGHALWLFTSGCRQGMVPPVMQQSSEEDRTLEVMVSAANSSIAVLGLIKWLRELLELLEIKQDPFVGKTKCMLIVENNPEPGPLEAELAAQAQEIQNAVTIVLEGLHSPFRPEDALQPGRKLIADSWRVSEWLQMDSVKVSITDYLPYMPKDNRNVCEGHCRTIAAQEAAANARLEEAHALFCQAEDHQEARLAEAQQAPEYAQSRQDCLQLAARLADRCGVSEEAVYTSMVLLDCAVWAGIPYTLGGAALLVASCLTVAAQMCDGARGCGLQQSSEMEAALNLPSGSLLLHINQLHSLRVADMAVATPTAMLSRYLGYLMHDSTAERLKPAQVPTSPRTKASLEGNSREILAAAMADASTQHISPSLLAAAALAVDRKNRGLVPTWPASLARWTSIAAVPPGGAGTVLEVAMRLVSAVAGAAPV